MYLQNLLKPLLIPTNLLDIKPLKIREQLLIIRDIITGLIQKIRINNITWPILQHTLDLLFLQACLNLIQLKKQRVLNYFALFSLISYNLGITFPDDNILVNILILIEVINIYLIIYLKRQTHFLFNYFYFLSNLRLFYLFYFLLFLSLLLFFR